MTGRLLFTFGTRPEAIKIAPVVAELRLMGVEPDLLNTGQHTDLLDGSPARTELAGAASLGLASDGTITNFATRAHPALLEAFTVRRPAAVVVQGDTMSALAAAVAASELGVPVVHLEAGVRSHDLAQPWPEESNRVEIAQLALHHLAPTQRAVDNLLAEKVGGTIVLTGNTVVSALARYGAPATEVVKPWVVVTLHRREIQTPTMTRDLVAKLSVLARAWPELNFGWPMHPGFEKQLANKPSDRALNLHVVNPMGYRDFVETVALAAAVITDSGGLVEEACTLGVPTLILRAVNDRPEAVLAGRAIQVSPTGDLLDGFQRTLQLGRQPSAVYGTPDAAKLAATYLVSLV